MEAAIGALRRALAGKHARRILRLAAVRIHAAGVRIGAGQVLPAQEMQQFAPVLEPWHRQLGDAAVAHGLGVVLALERLAAHAELEGVGARSGGARWPVPEQPDALGPNGLQCAVVGTAQLQTRGVGDAILQRCGRERLDRRGQRRLVQAPERLVQ